MSSRLHLVLSLSLALGLALSASDLSAQGRGSAKRGGGPPFCRNGSGHPVHGMRWCVEKGWVRGLRGLIYADDRYYGSRDRYNARDRYGSQDRYDSRSSNDHGAGRSYAREHDEFHRQLDRRYSDLSDRRPRDLRYQLELRLEKSAEHDRWHQRVGGRH